jgi:hypothetical protein
MTKSSPWPIRLQAAQRAYEDWSNKFRCDILEQYYEGFHWKHRKDFNLAGYNPYTVNLFYTTIKIKLANFLIKRPQFLIAPKPGNSDWNLDFAVKTANLKQDTLNTIINNMNVNFARHMKLAALDSFFRFGLIEVGYATDWRNPQKTEDELKSWDDTAVTPQEDKIIEENELLENESFFVKRIKPKRFRIASGEATDLKDHEWCGYYEFIYTNILKKTKGIKWPKEAPDTELYNSDYAGLLDREDVDSASRNYMLHVGSLSKVWHIFDNVSHTRYLYLDTYWDKPIFETDNYRLPFLDLRWDFRTEGFYPIPPCFNWLGPQDEINEAREQTRSYRRRFTRKFQVLQDNIDIEEEEKFASSHDGALIKVRKENAITPIENPNLGSTHENALLLAKDDFIAVSGTSAEVTKSADRETATKSALEDQRSRIRESAEQIDFTEFTCLVGREILMQAAEKMNIGMWIKWNGDPGDPQNPQGILKDIQSNSLPVQYITSRDISDGYDFEIEIDVINGTPAAMQQQQNSFITFLSLLQKFPMLALSPLLIRKAAHICGYRDEAVIQQLQQAAVLSMAAQASQQANKQGMSLEQAGQSANETQTKMKQMEQPTADTIENQIDSQLEGSSQVM